MHSYIIQVSPSPIAKEDYIREFDVLSNFVPRIGDYVNKVAPGYIAQVANYVFIGDDIFDFNKEKMTVTIKDKDNYFVNRYVTFKGLLKEISETVTLKSFAGRPDQDRGLNYKIRMLSQAYNTTDSFYICESGEDYPITLDEWMRSVDDGDVFYIGGALDYHC